MSRGQEAHSHFHNKHQGTWACDLSWVYCPPGCLQPQKLSAHLSVLLCDPGSHGIRAGMGTTQQYSNSVQVDYPSSRMMPGCLTAALLSGPTSGWNCCSVRVWQYWQASPFSHLPGSPHSSPCLTFGHGDDLVQQEGVGQQQERMSLAPVPHP